MDEIILQAIGSDWSTRAQIIKRLRDSGNRMNERSFRYWVEDWNQRYCDQEVDIYVAHGPNGYKVTQDIGEIKASVADLKCRAMDMLKKYSETRKALGRRLQTLLFEE